MLKKREEERTTIRADEDMKEVVGVAINTTRGVVTATTSGGDEELNKENTKEGVSTDGTMDE